MLVLVGAGAGARGAGNQTEKRNNLDSDHRYTPGTFVFVPLFVMLIYECTTTTAVIFAYVVLWRYCCGKALGKKKGENEKADAYLPCYPLARKPGHVIGVSPWAHLGDLFYVPLS